MKNKEVWGVLLATVVVGLALPLVLGLLMVQEWGRWVVFVLILMLCLGWPGYGLWISFWACRDIRRRWFLPPLFPVLLACTCGNWLGWLWPVGVFACAAMLVISVVVMLVTVSSKTEQ